MVKSQGEDREKLKAGRQAVRETLQVSERVLEMLKNTVTQLRTATSTNEEVKKRLFHDEEKKENVQLQMLRMLMSKRKAGTQTPRSVASEDESHKKRTRATDKPNEPANPPKTPRTQQPKIKPEAKVAPDILKEKDKATESPQESRNRKRDREGVPDKWLKKEWKESHGGFHCFHCGSDAHKAFEYPNMLDEAKEEGAEQLPQSVKRSAGCWLFCRLCFGEGKGFNITDDNGTKRIAIGWGSHTVQQCRLNNTGIDPSKPDETLVNPQKAKKAKGDERVIDVEAEEEKRKKAKSSTSAGSKPNIFTTPEGRVIPNPKWGEERPREERPRVEEKKMPKKTKESKDKEKKEKTRSQRRRRRRKCKTLHPYVHVHFGIRWTVLEILFCLKL